MVNSAQPGSSNNRVATTPDAEPAGSLSLMDRLQALSQQIQQLEQAEIVAVKFMGDRQQKATEAEDAFQRQATAAEKAAQIQATDEEEKAQRKENAAEQVAQRRATEAMKSTQSQQNVLVQHYETQMLAVVSQARSSLSQANRPLHPVVNEFTLAPASPSDISIDESVVSEHLRTMNLTLAEGDFSSYKPRNVDARVAIALVAFAAVLLVSFVLLGQFGLKGAFFPFVIGLVSGVIAYIQTGSPKANSMHRQAYQRLITEANVGLGAWESWKNQVATEQRARSQALAAGQQARSSEMAADHRTRSQALAAGQQARSREMAADHRTRSQALAATLTQEAADLKEKYRASFTALRPRLQAYLQVANAASPTWVDPVWQSFGQQVWTPPEALPEGVRLGEIPVSIDGQTTQTPVVAAFPGGVSLLIEASGAQKAAAAQLAQSVTARLLATIPPGKVRFTFVDPVGRGENVAAFMPLADHDPNLVSARVKTEPRDIEQALTDLTGHMETVIQKYLQNRFDTMEAYNQDADVVAEAYRVLVVVNFPVGFTEDAAKRLASIASSGPRCGVYTLITVDGDTKLPRDFNLGDLRRASTVIKTDSGQFHMGIDGLDREPLLDFEPPATPLLNAIVDRVGPAARAASVIQAPFAWIRPAREAWWEGDTREGVSVPIGVFGARRPRLFELGSGVAPHVLIAGKTGSGKSTLLHVLISSLVMRYSPEELELYLIDFKQGVEFQTYARHQLPHARVVAIESEREFGVSVLERLAAEIVRRGHLFKVASQQFGDIQSIAAYRNATGLTLPRILLIVDEFQVFFAEEDQLAGKAAQLLDLLVRQGRSFGIHAVLGSQSLNGARALNQSTFGQMGVRIALQCSEADAGLILSENNRGARLLERPGDGIYNDANGQPDGNKEFQVTWLDDKERESYLEDLLEMTQPEWRGRLKVFNGSELASLEGNELLEEHLDSFSGPSPVGAVSWLGDPIAIKSPAAIEFRQQAGCNLLVVGQDETAALGLSGAAILSLAAQYPAASVRFVVLDYIPADSPLADFLSTLLAGLPHDSERVGRRGAPAAIAALADEVTRRTVDEEGGHPPIFLFIHGLMRARDLRPSEDLGGSRFTFGSYGEESPRQASPAEQLARIAKEGPEVGVFTIVWCDTYSNVQRSLERATLREFDSRVAFQLSADDSLALIDTPAANKLGHNRAYLFSEERGTLEKFRPYGIPDSEWLDSAFARLQVRGGVEAAGGTQLLEQA